MPANESDVRRLLVEVAGDARSAMDMAPEAWARSRRHTRGRAVASATLVAVATAAVVLAANHLTTPPVGNSQIVAGESEASPEQATVEDVIQTVTHPDYPGHSAEDSSPSYVVDGRLWYGAWKEMTNGVPGSVQASRVIVGTPPGWMIQLERNGPVAGWLGDMGGDFRPFPNQDPSNPDAFAASPDGQYINMGASLLDESGQRIGSVPENLFKTQAWTPAGYVYQDQQGSAWLWNPGSAPERLDSTYNLQPDGRGIVQDGECSKVYELTAVGAVNLIATHCADNALISLSPIWIPGPKLALADDGRIYDLESGEQVQELQLPDGLLGLSEEMNVRYGAWWRGIPDSQARVPPKTFYSFVVPADKVVGSSSEHPFMGFILGCTTDDGECGLLLQTPLSSPSIPFVWR